MTSLQGFVEAPRKAPKIIISFYGKMLFVDIDKTMWYLGPILLVCALHHGVKFAVSCVFPKLELVVEDFLLAPLLHLLLLIGLCHTRVDVLYIGLLRFLLLCVRFEVNFWIHPGYFSGPMIPPARPALAYRLWWWWPWRRQKESQKLKRPCLIDGKPALVTLHHTDCALMMRWWQWRWRDHFWL